MISEERVLELCEIIRNRHKKSRWPFGIGKMQCWGCWKFGRKITDNGTIYNICALNNPNNRGCRQMNKLYDQLH